MRPIYLVRRARALAPASTRTPKRALYVVAVVVFSAACGVRRPYVAPNVPAAVLSHVDTALTVEQPFDPRWWQPCSWQTIEIRELAAIEPHFHFKRIAPTVFEVRPAGDPAAMDQPNLENLLPENRTEEARRCVNAG